MGRRALTWLADEEPRNVITEQLPLVLTASLLTPLTASTHHQHTCTLCKTKLRITSPRLAGLFSRVCWYRLSQRYFR